MMNIKRYIPHVEEAQAVEQTLAVGTGTALSAIPSIHAQRIDLILESASPGAVGNDIAVTLRLYGASKQAFVDVLLGTTVESDTDGYVHTGFIGQSFDVRVQNTDGQGDGDAAQYTIWVGARP
jgi:hypothetical protein